MFGHLKAEDFTNLIEGIDISLRRQAHLEKCSRCAEEWKAVEAIHLSIASGEDDIVEPDWSEFRTSVREEMLSRSARRSVENRRWSVWRLAPAGISLAAAMGAVLFVGRFMMTPEVAPPSPPEGGMGFALDEYGLETEKAVWSRASALDDVVSLGPEESERFRQLLEIETRLGTQDEAPGELSPGELSQ